jgi:hypothetical protein
MESHFARRYPILPSPSIARGVPRAVPDGSVIWSSPSCRRRNGEIQANLCTQDYGEPEHCRNRGHRCRGRLR